MAERVGGAGGGGDGSGGIAASGALERTTDGVTGLTQPAIAPGNTFVSEFVARRPGTFMYHPHGDEMVQMAMGMMGFWITHPKNKHPLIDEVDRLLKGNLEPVFEEQYLGRAEVRMVIHHPKSGNIAGSYITDGMFKRNAKAKVTRGKEVVYEGTVVGLKRFKDDVREVQQGYECGINLDWNDVMEGDIIEASMARGGTPVTKTYVVTAVSALGVPTLALQSTAAG